MQKFPKITSEIAVVGWNNSNFDNNYVLDSLMSVFGCENTEIIGDKL